MLEAENEENGEMQQYYKSLYKEFKNRLKEESPHVLESIERQIQFR